MALDMGQIPIKVVELQLLYEAEQRAARASLPVLPLTLCLHPIGESWSRINDHCMHKRLDTFHTVLVPEHQQGGFNSNEDAPEAHFSAQNKTGCQKNELGQVTDCVHATACAKSPLHTHGTEWMEADMPATLPALHLVVHNSTTDIYVLDSHACRYGHHGMISQSSKAPCIAGLGTAVCSAAAGAL